MDDKEIIRRIAVEVMGWRQAELEPSGQTEFFIQEYPRPYSVWASVDDGNGGRFNWNPLENIEQAFRMQAAIKTAGQDQAYADALHLVLCEQNNGPIYTSLWFAFADATARQRCEAAIAMLGGQQ